MPELTLIQEFSDDDLLQELSSRFDDFIFAARKKGYGGAELVQRRRYWKGDYDACIGLLHGAAFDCLIKNWKIKDEDITY